MIFCREEKIIIIWTDLLVLVRHGNFAPHESFDIRFAYLVISVLTHVTTCSTFSERIIVYLRTIVSSHLNIALKVWLNDLVRIRRWTSKLKITFFFFFLSTSYMHLSNESYATYTRDQSWIWINDIIRSSCDTRGTSHSRPLGKHRNSLPTTKRTVIHSNLGRITQFP